MEHTNAFRESKQEKITSKNKTNLYHKQLMPTSVHFYLEKMNLIPRTTKVDQNKS